MRSAIVATFTSMLGSAWCTSDLRSSLRLPSSYTRSDWPTPASSRPWKGVIASGTSSISVTCSSSSRGRAAAAAPPADAPGASTTWYTRRKQPPCCRGWNVRSFAVPTTMSGSAPWLANAHAHTLSAASLLSRSAHAASTSAPARRPTARARSSTTPTCPRPAASARSAAAAARRPPPRPARRRPCPSPPRRRRRPRDAARRLGHRRLGLLQLLVEDRALGRCTRCGPACTTASRLVPGMCTHLRGV